MSVSGFLYRISAFTVLLSSFSALSFRSPVTSFKMRYSVSAFEMPRSSSTTLKMSSLFESDDDGVDDAIGAPIGPLPSVSSKHNYGDETPQNVVHDIWVVGAGTLGMLAIKEWKTMFPESTIIAETRTDSRHAEFISMGVTPKLRSERTESDLNTARYVLITLPPSSNKEDYVGEVSDASRLWAGPLGQGHLAFTSSSSVYGDSDGNTVDEIFRLDTRSQRSTNLIAAEESVLSRGGSVVRLAGLYTLDRGPHTFWLKNGTCTSNADGLVNTLHYEDAARVAIAACLYGVAGTAYLACDDEPVTREEICAAALASGRFPGLKMPKFASVTGPQGKITNGQRTREALQWSPLPDRKTYSTYMRSTLGGDSSYETTKQKLTRERQERTDVKNKAKGIAEGTPPASATSSFLWIPGDDEDADNDIFKL